MPRSVKEPASEYSQIVDRWRSEGPASVEHELREHHASRPDDAQVTKMLALTLCTLDRYDEAKEMLLRALAQAPTSPELLLALGSAQNQHRDYGDAELTARQLLEVKPDSARAQLLLGYALTGQARYRGALGPLGRALRRRDTRYTAAGLYSIALLVGSLAPAAMLPVALVIFARWKPELALVGALLFGLADAVQYRIQALSQVGRGAGTIPYEFLLMLPYVLTLLALLYRVKRSETPAALGRPHNKGPR